MVPPQVSLPPNMKRAPFAFGFLALAVLVLGGCSATPSWVRGDWVFDKDRTDQAMKTNSGSDLMSGLASMVTGMLVSQIDTMEIIITNTDETVTVSGQGHFYPFQVVSKSDAQFVLKKADGTVETYYRDGDDIYFYGTGAASSLKIYFKRKS
jgi:hypothetical protein